jgi:hypothetical protein
MLSDDMLNQVKECKENAESEDELFHKVASSICPEIFAMDEVK